jgi:adenylate cyclase
MDTEEVKRKLAAVLHADVKGYSRLMGEDDVATVRTLTEHKEVLTRLVQVHRGRVVDTAGDGFLLEFASVVDAVQYAVKLQQELKARNAEMSEERRMEFRIGINVGDVIQQGEQIFGDGVNIAARLEGLAEPGGICISGTAYDQVKNKLKLEYGYLGKQSVKNIAEPVRVYRVLAEPSATAASSPRAQKVKSPGLERSVLASVLVIVAVVAAVAVWHIYPRAPIPPEDVSAPKAAVVDTLDKPSIAVLPFVNMSGDPEQEYFSDGMTEEIITRLAQVPKLFVIARNSTFAFKGKPVNVKQVCQELGVRYVLEGSVRRAADRVRITAQLIDAKSGAHAWAERYDRDLRDVFGVQDEITEHIVSALQVKLTGEESALAAAEKAPAQNPEASEKIMRAMGYMGRESQDANLRARELLEQAAILDPQSARAHAALAKTYLSDVAAGWSKSPRASMEKAEAYAQKALALNDKVDFTHLIMSRISLSKRQHDEAIQEAERAVALNPNGADAWASLGRALVFGCRPEEAIERLNKAIRLNPIPPNWYFQMLGSAYAGAKRYDDAVAAHKKAIQQHPGDPEALMGLAAAYSLAGRQEEARAAAAELLHINPRFTVDQAAKKLPYKNPVDLSQLTDALRKAGLK